MKNIDDIPIHEPTPNGAWSDYKKSGEHTELANVWFEPAFDSIDGIKILLTIKYNETSYTFLDNKLLKTKIFFGVTRGELEIICHDSYFPIGLIEPKNTYQVQLQAERTVTYDKSEERSIKTEKKVDLETTANPVKSKSKAGLGSQSLNKINTHGSTSDSFEYDIVNISTRGTEEKPCWIFEKIPGQENYLKGSLNDYNIGTMVSHNGKLRFSAYLKVDRRDIYLTHKEGKIFDNLHINKEKIASVIYKNMIINKLSPFIVKVEACYG